MRKLVRKKHWIKKNLNLNKKYLLQNPQMKNVEISKGVIVDGAENVKESIHLLYVDSLHRWENARKVISVKSYTSKVKRLRIVPSG